MNIFGIAYAVIGIGLTSWAIYDGVLGNLHEVIDSIVDIDDDIMTVMITFILVGVTVIWPILIAITLCIAINDHRRTNKEDEDC